MAAKAMYGSLITAKSKTAEMRAQAIKLNRIYFIGDRGKKLDELEEELGLKDEEVCFLGDDIVDIPVMRRVGFAVAPADAREEAKAVAHYITEAGGKGVIREAGQFILDAQGKWQAGADKMLSMYKQLK